MDSIVLEDYHEDVMERIEYVIFFEQAEFVIGGSMPHNKGTGPLYSDLGFFTSSYLASRWVVGTPQSILNRSQENLSNVGSPVGTYFPPYHSLVGSPH